MQTIEEFVESHYDNQPDVDFDGWLHNVDMLLDGVIDEAESDEDVLLAITIQRWMYDHADLFKGNIAALIHSLSGQVARILKLGVEISDKIPHPPREVDAMYIWDIKQILEKV